MRIVSCVAELTASLSQPLTLSKLTYFHETCNVRHVTSRLFTVALRNLFPSVFTYNDSLPQQTELKVLNLEVRHPRCVVE